MSDDLLREATRAVRETTEDSGDSGAFTRMRIMHSLHGARRRRMTRVVVWAPLAAILAGATAAAATGQAARVWFALERAVVSEPRSADAHKPPPAARRTRSGGRRPVQPPAPEPAAAAETTAGDTAEPSVLEPEATPAPTTEALDSRIAKSKRRASALGHDARGARSGLAATQSSAEDLAAARELDLYRAAHRAHFQEHDCQAAVQAWERYLAQAPRGRFTLEARYNRALCLVRLGQEGAAAAALRPFAQGSFGGYRQSDARALLKALESEDPATR